MNPHRKWLLLQHHQFRIKQTLYPWGLGRNFLTSLMGDGWNVYIRFKFNFCNCYIFFLSVANESPNEYLDAEQKVAALE